MSNFKEAIWSTNTLKYEYNRFKLINGEIDKDDLARFDRQMYANFYNRTGLIFKIREYNFKNGIQSNLRKNEIVISCISSNLILSENAGDNSSDLDKVQCRDNCSLLKLGKGITIQDWTDMRLTELKEAVKSRPDVICFGELSYPPPTNPNHSDATPDIMFNYGQQRHIFETEVRKILERASSEAFTFLGSYHCTQSLYNVGVIYPLGYQAAEFNVLTSEEPLNGGKGLGMKEKITPPITYLKRFPARRAGEETRVPTGNRFEVYETKFGRIAIMICSDIIDLNQFLMIARRNLSNQRESIDIILLPSFNKSRRLVSMCRELSYLANTVVVNVNANAGDEAFPNTGIYVCGLDTDQLPSDFVSIKSTQVLHAGLEDRISVVYEFHLMQGVQKLRDAALRSHPAEARGSAGNMRPANF